MWNYTSVTILVRHRVMGFKYKHTFTFYVGQVITVISLNVESECEKQS